MELGTFLRYHTNLGSTLSTKLKGKIADNLLLLFYKQLLTAILIPNPKLYWKLLLKHIEVDTNGRPFADKISKYIFLNEMSCRV